MLVKGATGYLCDDCCSCSCHHFWRRCWYCKSLWVSQSWRTPCWMLPPKFVVSPHQSKPKTWWWNEEVDNAIQENRSRFRVHSAPKKGGMAAEAKGKTAYFDAKRVAKHAVWLAKSGAKKKNSPLCAQIVIVFSVSPNRWAAETRTMYNDDGEVALTDEDKRKAWAEHYARLLNVEFEMLSNELPEVPPIQLPPLPVRPRHWSTKRSAKWNAARLLTQVAS